MSLRDLFTSKAKKQEDEKKMTFLKYLVYMAACDGQTTEDEAQMIIHIMSERKGMDKQEALEEIKSLLKNGFQQNLQVPETQEERDELFCFLATEMLMDQKIEKQEWSFLTLMAKTLYKVDDTTAHNMAVKVCKGLIDTGSFPVTEVNID